MSHPANDKLSEAMDTIAHKFVKELRSAVSEQITLSIEKEILSQIEKVNIISGKTSASEKTSSSPRVASSSLTNDTRNNVQDNEFSLHSNEHSSTGKESASVDIDDISKKEKKKKKKRKRQADDGEEIAKRFSCNQQ